jgi:hypothetical protein
MANPSPTERLDPGYGQSPDHDYVELTEEQASQGYKTGHMRWVLAIGFALAGIALALTAVLT